MDRESELGCLALEELIYMRLIEQLANEKLALFVRELEKAKKSKMTKGTSKKQRRSTVKVLPKKECKHVVINEVTERLKEFVNKMNGIDMNLVIQKKLFCSDLDASQNRLNIPINQVEKHEFLTPDEKKFLLSDVNNEIEVGVLGPRLSMFEKTMEFKIWSMTTTKNYVLKGKFWGKFVNDYQDDLKVGTLIQVWSFRKDRQLCLAIACVNGLDGDQNNVP